MPPSLDSVDTAQASKEPGNQVHSKTHPDANRDTMPPPDPAPESSSSVSEVIPLAREEIKINTEKHETRRVRITKRIRTREEVVDQPAITEELEITRVPINRPVDGPVAVRTEGDTTIVPVVEEVLVVVKRLVLREEVRIRKTRVETRQPQKILLRQEEVEIEEIPTTPAAAG